MDPQLSCQLVSRRPVVDSTLLLGAGAAPYHLKVLMCLLPSVTLPILRFLLVNGPIRKTACFYRNFNYKDFWPKVRSRLILKFRYRKIWLWQLLVAFKRKLYRSNCISREGRRLRRRKFRRLGGRGSFIGRRQSWLGIAIGVMANSRTCSSAAVPLEFSSPKPVPSSLTNSTRRYWVKRNSQKTAHSFWREG